MNLPLANGFPIPGYIVFLFLASFVGLPVPLITFIVRAAVKARERYLRRRWWVPLTYYGVLAAIIAGAALASMHDSGIWLLFFMLWGYAGLPYAFLMFIPLSRPPEGYCPNCSYDLRAHAAGDKCPECGMMYAGPQAKGE